MGACYLIQCTRILGLMGAVMGKFIKMGTHMITKSVQETTDDLAAIK
jgi:hypothetical protein